jgi:hypothetical protein
VRVPALHDPGRLAAELELEVERYRRAALLLRTPPAMADLTETLGRIAALLRDADARGQSVDLADDLVALIRRFRRELAAYGGAPARA